MTRLQRHQCRAAIPRHTDWTLPCPRRGTGRRSVGFLPPDQRALGRCPTKPQEIKHYKKHTIKRVAIDRAGIRTWLIVESRPHKDCLVNACPDPAGSPVHYYTTHRGCIQQPATRTTRTLPGAVGTAFKIKV